MAVNDENNQAIYEVDEKGERVKVRSITSEHCVCIRFVNRVSRPVDVWWRDFQGRRRHYVRMSTHTYFNVDTFVTHPWEFTDPSTKESYVINNKAIYRVPSSLAGMRHRTSWLISVKVRSLKDSALMCLADKLIDKSQVQALGLPRSLNEDLQKLVDAIQNTPPPPSTT